MTRLHVSKVMSRPSRIVVLGWAAGGAAMVAGALIPGFDANPSISLSPIVELVLGALMVIGATLASMSALNWKHESTSWRLELLAHPILATVWLMYFVLVAMSSVGSLFPEILAVSFAAAAAQRWFEVRRASERTRSNVEAWKKRLDDPDDA